MKKLTEIERGSVLDVLSSAITCFENLNYLEDIGYTDGGEFLCSLPSIEHIKSLTTAYNKICLG